MITNQPGGAGRPLWAKDLASGISYVTGPCGPTSDGVCYAPQGSAASLQNGASIVSTLYYNSRLQPCRISVKSSGTAPTQCSDTTNIGNVLDFSYNFSVGTADNGNVVSIANNRNRPSERVIRQHLLLLCRPPRHVACHRPGRPDDALLRRRLLPLRRRAHRHQHLPSELQVHRQRTRIRPR